MADNKYRDDEAKAPSQKNEYRGTEVVSELKDREPGLENVPLFESFIAPASSYRKLANTLLSRGGPAKATPKKGKEYRKGGKVSASTRGDGIAQRGKTKGRIV